MRLRGGDDEVAVLQELRRRVGCHERSDDELAIAVQNFQREHRLNVDGIAGVQTQVVLDTALADPNSPVLLANALRGG